MDIFNPGDRVILVHYCQQQDGTVEAMPEESGIVKEVINAWVTVEMDSGKVLTHFWDYWKHASYKIPEYIINDFNAKIDAERENLLKQGQAQFELLKAKDEIFAHKMEQRLIDMSNALELARRVFNEYADKNQVKHPE